MKPIIEEPFHTAQACIVWMHGLGASAADMRGLAAQMEWSTVPTRHVYLQAPTRPVTINNGMAMPAWFDILGTNLTDRQDEAAIVASARAIAAVIAEQSQQGIARERIFLAGFSQGGAMALYTGLQEEKTLGGVIALSAYVPLAEKMEPVQSRDIPIFMAHGRHDSLVLPQWVKASELWLQSQGYTQLSSHNYSMDHSVCLEETQDLQKWLNGQLQRSMA